MTNHIISICSRSKFMQPGEDPMFVSKSIEKLESDDAHESISAVHIFVKSLSDCEHFLSKLEIFAQKPNKVRRIALQVSNLDSDKEIRQMENFLYFFKNVTDVKLIFRHKHSSNDEINILVNYFESQTNIKRLELIVNCYLLSSIAQVVRTNSSIEYLYLEISPSMRIDNISKHIIDVATCLSNNTTIQSFSLRCDATITPDDFNQIKQAFSDSLLDNYTIIDFTANFPIADQVKKVFLSFNEITNRNKLISDNKKFFVTKVAER